jgi:hypothetical protein
VPAAPYLPNLLWWKMYSNWTQVHFPQLKFLLFVAFWSIIICWVRVYALQDIERLLNKMYDWKGFKGVVVVQRVQIIEPKCWIHTCTYHAHGLRTPRGVQAVITPPMLNSSCFWKLCEKVESSYHRLFKYVLWYYKVCISYTSCKFSIASNVVDFANFNNATYYK